MRWGAVFALCAACRIGFDERAAPDSRATVDDAPVTPIAPVFVQHHADSLDSQDKVSTTFDDPVTAGDLLVIGVDLAPTGSVLAKVTDSLDNTYTILPSTGGAGQKDIQYIAYALSTSSGACTVTAKLDVADVGFFELRAHEYANVSQTDPFDTAAGATGAGSGSDAAVTPDIVTDEPNELVFGLVVDGLVTAGAGFTTRGSDFADVTEDMIATTPGSYRVTATTTAEWAASVAAFHGASP